jgi:Fusaric acid resistance protein family
LPQSVVPLVKCRLDQWFRDTCIWSAAVLRRCRKNDSQTSLLLARDAVAFDALVTPLQYDMSDVDRSAEVMATLRQHMLMFLPFVAAIADRLETLEKARALPPKIRQGLDDIAAWLASGTKLWGKPPGERQSHFLLGPSRTYRSRQIRNSPDARGFPGENAHARETASIKLLTKGPEQF